jgi:hypothetical protein
MSQRRGWLAFGPIQVQRRGQFSVVVDLGLSHFRQQLHSNMICPVAVVLGQQLRNCGCVSLHDKIIDEPIASSIQDILIRVSEGYQILDVIDPM